MPKNPFDAWPEVFVSNSRITEAVSRAVAQGTIRRIGSKVYTKNLTDPPESIVKRHFWTLVGAYVPDALVADRTAIENAPASDGSVFVVSDRKRPVELPGLTIRPRKGRRPLESDLPFAGGVRLSSTARAYLDNMAGSRSRDGAVSRTLTRAELETRLDDMIRLGGAEAVNRLRDEARRIAPLIGRDAEFLALDKLIGSLLGTRTEPLATSRGQARAAGAPFDPNRLALFERLHGELRSTPPLVRPTQARTAEAQATLAFYEAYFSNSIEGTEFEVSEAADVVFNNVIPSGRPADAHDILGTWRLVSDPTEMSRRPQDGASLIDLLRRRHAVLMQGRPDKRPGSLKSEANRAGQTVFVDPAEVEGTLERGFELIHSLETPFARAVYMMFLVSEVHPFADGNGRVARVMMNAELVAAGEERIIIPTIFRSNYLDGLKALSGAQNPTTLVRSLDFAQRWVAAVPWTTVRETETVLTQCNAFMDPVYADEHAIRLRLPGAGAP